MMTLLWGALDTCSNVPAILDLLFSFHSADKRSHGTPIEMTYFKFTHLF